MRCTGIVPCDIFPNCERDQIQHQAAVACWSRNTRPNGNGTEHLDNGRLEQAIARFQLQGDANALGEIITLTEKRALTLIRFHKTARYVPEDELLSDVNCKLLKSVGKFDRAKGSAFTFLSQVIMNTLRTSVTNARAVFSQYVEFDDAIANKLRTNGETESQDAIDDLAHRRQKWRENDADSSK
jgi:hypothetical protein